MNPEQHDDIQRLTERLDQAIPPYQGTIGDPADDPLVEAAARIARLPKTQLSQDSSDLLEAKLRAYASELGPPRSGWRGQGKRWLPILAAGLLAFFIGLSLLQYASPNLPGSDSDPTPTATASSTPTPSPTETSPAPGTLIIEGVVQEVGPGTVTIYGITIQVAQETLDALNIEIGDYLHIEGYADGSDLTIEVVETPMPPTSPLQNPSPGTDSINDGGGADDHDEIDDVDDHDEIDGADDHDEIDDDHEEESES